MHVPTTDLRLMLTIHPFHPPAHATVHLRWSVQRWSCTHGSCIYWCARFTDTCRCCHGAGEDSLRMQSAAKRSHHAEKVSSGMPQRAPHEMSSAWTPLSHTVVFVSCSAWVCLGACVDCSIHASSAALSAVPSKEIGFTSVLPAIMSVATPPLLLQSPLPLRLLLHLSRCSDVQLAASTSSLSSSGQPS